MTRNRSLLIGLVLLAASLSLALYFYFAEKEHQLELRQPDPIASPLEMEVSREEVPLVKVEITLLRSDVINPGSPRFSRRPVEMPVIEDLAVRAREIVNVVLKNSEEWVSPLARALQVFLLEDGTAVVDLAPEVSEMPFCGVEAELGLLESIVTSLRDNIPEIEGVRFVVDGRPQNTLCGHVSIRRPFR